MCNGADSRDVVLRDHDTAGRLRKGTAIRSCCVLYTDTVYYTAMLSFQFHRYPILDTNLGL